jgi:hypothetical protein
MALTIAQLFPPTQLGLASAVIYAAPATPTSSVLKNGRVRLTNTTALAETVTLYVAPSATASSAANCCLNAESIAANSHIDVDIPTMAAGDTLRGKSGAVASAITVHELGGILYS